MRPQRNRTETIGIIVQNIKQKTVENLPTLINDTIREKVDSMIEKKRPVISKKMGGKKSKRGIE